MVFVHMLSSSYDKTLMDDNLVVEEHTFIQHQTRLNLQYIYISSYQDQFRDFHHPNQHKSLHRFTQASIFNHNLDLNNHYGSNTYLW